MRVLPRKDSIKYAYSRVARGVAPLALHQYNYGEGGGIHDNVSAQQFYSAAKAERLVKITSYCDEHAVFAARLYFQHGTRSIYPPHDRMDSLPGYPDGFARALDLACVCCT